MKKKGIHLIEKTTAIIVLFIVILIVTNIEVKGQTYCTNTNTTNTSYYISSFFTTGGTTNITNNSSGFSANGYGNFTAMAVTQMQTQVINFSITETGGTMHFGIWVDWNDDGDFTDSGEEVYINTTYNSSVTGSFTVPLTATAGSHRMRVVGNELGTVTACTGSGYTECEDYTFTVTSLPACSGTPTGGTATATTTSVSGCTGYVGAISVTGSTAASGLTYQWQSSTTGAAPWTDIAGATDLTYTVTVPGLYYRRVITCTSSSGTAYSSSLLYSSSAPVNDECVNAIILTPSASENCTSSVSGTVACASASSQANSCSGTADDDVWYKFVATSNIHKIKITNVAGSVTDMYFSVYSGTCGSLTNISCSDLDSTTVGGLIIGNTYYVRVYTYTSTTGQTTTFNICVATIPPPSVQLPCTNLGFESGLTGWYGTEGNPIDGAATALTPTYVPAAFNETTGTNFALMTAGTDPLAPINKVYNGTYSLRLGNSATYRT